MIKVQIDVPAFANVNDRLLQKALNRVGGRLATMVRQALRQGRTYEGAPLPTGDAEAPIDLFESGTLLRSIRYSSRLNEIGAFGPHPSASPRAGSSYGLMRILQSGKARGKVRVRDEFDAFGTDGDRTNILKEAARMLEDEIEKLGEDLFR